MSTQPRGHPRFDELWPLVDAVRGWLTREQARVLFDAVTSRGPAPKVVEIGSHHGRSTLVLASAREDVHVTAVDPFVTSRLFAGPLVRRLLEGNVERLGLDDRVEILASTSRAVRGMWDEPVDVLYIDGKHDYWTVSDDLRWVDHVVPGGPVLVHDAFSSVGVTLALLRHVLPGRSLRYLGRTGSLARFVAEPPAASDRLRILAELPWWLRNVGIKVLLRLHLTRVAAAMGHHDQYDPY